MAQSAERMLMNEFKALSKETWTNIEVCIASLLCLCLRHTARRLAEFCSQLINENVFEWSVALIVLNPDSPYYGGYYKAKLTFPKNYPYMPPGPLTTPLTSWYE